MMKKFLVMVVAVFTMMMTGTALAADVDKNFEKENEVVETLVKSFTDTTVTYAAVERSIAPELKEKFSDKEFAALNETVKDKFGRTKEVKFVSYEHFDKSDKLVYLGSFSKEKIVLMTFFFDNQTRKPMMNGMTMIPLEVKADGTIVEKKME